MKILKAPKTRSYLAAVVIMLIGLLAVSCVNKSQQVPVSPNVTSQSSPSQAPSSTVAPKPSTPSISTSTPKPTTSTGLSPDDTLRAYWLAIEKQDFPSAESRLSVEANNYFRSNWDGLKDYAGKTPPYRGFQKLEITKIEPLTEGEFLDNQVRISSMKWYLIEGQQKKWEYVDYLVKRDNSWKILISPILGSLPVDRVKRFYILLNDGKYEEARLLLSPETAVAITNNELATSFDKYFRGRKINDIRIDESWPDQPRFVVENDRWVYDFWVKGTITFADGSREDFQEHLAETPNGFKIGYE